MSRLLLIDGTNTVHRFHHVYSDLTMPSGYRLGGVFGGWLGIKKQIRKHKDFVAVVVFDGARSARRMDLFPDYKQNRKKQEPEEHDEFYVSVDIQVPLLRRLLSSLGIVTISVDHAEADDIIGLLSLHAEASIIYSSDKDFYQLVRPGHRVKRAGKTVPDADGVYDDIVISSATFERDTGWRTPDEYLIAKALMGDSSDNIPGVKGIGEKTAKKILAACRDVQPTGKLRLDTLRTVAADSSSKVWQRIDDQWDDFMLYHKIMDLSRYHDFLGADGVQDALRQLFSFNTEVDVPKLIAVSRQLQLKEVLDEEITWLVRLMGSRRRALNPASFTFPRDYLETT